MAQRNLTELVAGAAVLLVAAGFLGYAVANTGRGSVSGLTFRAKFEGAFHDSFNKAGAVVRGTILALDQPFGNVWTNIRAGVLDSAGVKLGDTLEVTIRSQGTVRFKGRLPFVKSFGAVGRERPLAYLDSMLDLAFALNQASFATRYRVGRGSDWQVEVVVPAPAR